MGATGHLKSVQAIHEVLASNPKGDKSQKWVQIGRASLLAAAELADKARVPGTGSEVVHYDLQGIEEIRWKCIVRYRCLRSTKQGKGCSGLGAPGGKL